MRVGFICAAAALALACAPAAEDTGGALAEGCDARAVQAWNATPDATLSVEATSAGPGCDRAVATLVIRDASGFPLYTDTHIASQVMVLAGAADQAAMQTALAEWAESSNTTMVTTSALPDWPQGAEAPSNGEFPFYPDDGIDRTAYLALRAQNLPLFCYVQGMESLRCVAYGEGAVSSVGLQLFPG